ncbi:hypothetical protein [Maribacter sp. 2210JD10-5]|uniref:DUF6438 domain-containing protein n=1 Tax=Maribacter sp. 2210JD10-5 TaxID=3386272 RepID=UPI0039BC8DB5
MNNVMYIFGIILFPSDGRQYNALRTEQNKVLLYYSKRPCSRKHPKFDLWVFTDGRVLYKEIYGPTEYGEVRSVLSGKDIDDLTQLLEYSLQYSSYPKKVGDLPVTNLKPNGREFEYQASTIDGPLKAVDTQIEGLLGKLHIANLVPE